jgi:CHAD domain-containing protein
MKVSSSARQADGAATSSPPAHRTPAAAATAAAPQPFDPIATAHDVALAELRRLLAAWAFHEPGARLGQDPEELHQLRVTARRIDATLGLFKHQLPPALVRARKSAKVVLRTLGAARDLDVQLGELARYCAQLSEEQRAAAEPLKARLETERVRARARMVRGLDSEPTRRWLETLSVASTERSGLNGADRAMAVMPERVRQRFRRLRKSVRRLRTKSTMDDYHEVRRRAKQLRYATECGRDLFGRPAEDMLKALRRLQDKLGAHQDAYMAQMRLAALAADPDSGLPPATLFLMGRLAEHHDRATAQTRQTLTRSWRKVRGKRWKGLRVRLGELSEGAQALNGALAPAALAAPEPAPMPSTAAAHAPGPELYPIKH